MNKKTTKKWYESFKWFYTSSGLLVIGGKSAKQNEELIKKHLDKKDIVLHTKTPGSPFCIIKAKKKISSRDIKEAAIFCGCFSQQWKKAKSAEVHIFKADQIMKEPRQKIGTFSVIGRVQKAKVKLELVLTKQKGKLRAVPASAAKIKLYVLKPGKIAKEKFAEIIKEKLKLKIEEIMQAIPAGSFKL